MSDFENTMRAWRRMCVEYKKLYGSECCMHCSLDGLKSCGGIWGIKDVAYGEIEEKVKAWAAENPEPQYPTWVEWLEEMGLTRRSVTVGRLFNAIGTDSTQESTIPFIVMLSSNACNPIPADIAEKLGLKPKGGNEND